jgi:hypothetical protein
MCTAFTTSKQLQSWLSRKRMRLASSIVSYLLRTLTAQEGCSLLACTREAEKLAVLNSLTKQRGLWGAKRPVCHF